jgi:hypothetical protein
MRALGGLHAERRGILVTMKKPLTVTEFARLGGEARAKKLSAERRREIASQAGKKGGRGRKQPPLDKDT